MADQAIVGILLNHINPSMMVTGQRSALPGGDKVGTLLNHINPSMMARLAGESTYEPHRACPPANLGPRPTAEAIRQTPARSKAGPACGPPRVGWAKRLVGPGFRSRPIDSSSRSGSPRQLDHSLNAGPAEDVSRPMKLSWPWNQPLPPPAPTAPAGQVPYTLPGQPALGELIDVFA